MSEGQGHRSPSLAAEAIRDLLHRGRPRESPLSASERFSFACPGSACSSIGQQVCERLEIDYGTGA
eukprot:12681481-Prorocentrum_lima.AAC.1